MFTSYKFLALLLLFIILSCSGLDDLIMDRHPQLEEMQVSGARVAPFDTVYASIKATNPIDGILEFKWKIDPDRGNFVGPSDTDSVRWVAPIQGGFYELKVTVKNTAKQASDASQIEVLVTERPIVDIRKPALGDYYVIGQTISIEARADHANGLSWVQAFINDSLVAAPQDQNGTGIYQFTCIADSTMVGTAEVKIKAKSNYVAEPGSDLIDIQVGGIITGKHGSKSNN